MGGGDEKEGDQSSEDHLWPSKKMRYFFNGEHCLCRKKNSTADRQSPLFPTRIISEHQISVFHEDLHLFTLALNFTSG